MGMKRKTASDRGSSAGREGTAGSGRGRPARRPAAARTKVLKKAHALFRRGKYSEVIRVLEPQVFLYRENALFYYLLGLSCLRTGDLGGAESYLNRASHIDDESVPVLLALAAVQVRRLRSDEALQTWLAVIEQDPNNRIAKRGLALLRAADSDAVLHEAIDGDRIVRYLPSEAVSLSRPLRVAGLIAVVGLLAGTALWVAPHLSQRVREFRGPEEERSGTELARLERETAELASYEGQFRYVLTEPEIRQSFRRMGDYFNAFRDNRAMIEINRILNSNAAPELKRRAALLSEYIRAPGFADFQDNASFAEVSREPWLYADSYVRWSGRISNLDVGEEEIRFDLLVGYETERVLEGIVPVRLTFAARLHAAMAVEIIGRVVVTDDRLDQIDATSIRMINPE